MKRFLFMSMLLVLLLVIARAAGADDDFSFLGPTTERARFFEHGFRSEGLRYEWSGSTKRRHLDAPRRVGDAVRFTLHDRGYQRAWIETSANDWVGEAMEYDPGNDRWIVELELPRGRHEYVFVVEDRDGDRRVRTDTSNPRRLRDRERGWVSAVDIDRRGDVVERRSRSERRRDRRFRGGDFELVDDVIVRYQRVDGFVLGFRPVLRTSDPWSPRLDGEFTYGFSSDRWSSRLSFLQPLARHGVVRAHLSAYDRSDTVDRTGVGGWENSLATLIFREDAYDWFRREGLSVGIEAEPFAHFLARVEFRSDEYSSLDREVIAGWGGREDFLPNPAIDEGLMRSIFARVRIGSDLDHLWLEYEASDDGFAATDYDFSQLTAQYRGRMHLGDDTRLDVRLRYGTTLSGELPRQKRYVAGGIGTVRGYVYQSLRAGESRGDGYGGEQTLLANAEMTFGNRHGDFAAAVFVDAGQVWVDRDDAVDLDDMVSSLGVGLLFDEEDDGLRIDLIRPLEGDDDLMVQMRLRRPF